MRPVPSPTLLSLANELQPPAVFIYSCPSGSPVKPRMIYSATCRALYHVSKSLLMSPNAHLVSRTVETSDPAELGEAYLKEELGLGEEDTSTSGASGGDSGLSAVAGGTKLGAPTNAFAKPRGPARKR